MVLTLSAYPSASQYCTRSRQHSDTLTKTEKQCQQETHCKTNDIEIRRATPKKGGLSAPFFIQRSVQPETTALTSLLSFVPAHFLAALAIRLRAGSQPASATYCSHVV